ncbi:hypothetical protein Ct9H90mP29_05000 [bacterium]|nr:MAG: hypothetical protein Ct9H90mP29_05000 [bacterium]
MKEVDSASQKKMNKSRSDTQGKVKVKRRTRIVRRRTNGISTK